LKVLLFEFYVVKSGFIPYMWKEIIGKFSIFGKEILPKNGKKKEMFGVRKRKH